MSKKKYTGRALSINKKIESKGVGDSAVAPSVGDEFGESCKKLESEVCSTVRTDLNCPIFKNYAYLDKLSMITEIHIACEESVNDVFRNGYKINSSSDEKRQDIIKRLEEDFVKFKVDNILKSVGFNAEAYGNAYICARFNNDAGTLSTDLILEKGLFKIGSLRAFVSVDPIWVTPPYYNAVDPLEENFYKPNKWIISGSNAYTQGDGRVPKSVKELTDYSVSRTRMEQLVLYPVPDLYKPEFLFGGLSLSQMMLPYVNNFLEVRDDIPRIVKTYRTQVWYTNIMSIAGNKGSFTSRLNTFAYSRDNFGVLAADKDSEKIEQINTSISGLEQIQDSLLKLISVPSRLSVVAFTGEQKRSGGLGSTESPERIAQQEHVAGKQQASYRPLMMWILKIICFNAFGEWYEDLYIDFNPLEEMNEQEIAELNNKNIDSMVSLIDAGVITPEQALELLSSNEKSLISGVKYENTLSNDEEDYSEPSDY